MLPPTCLFTLHFSFFSDFPKGQYWKKIINLGITSHQFFLNLHPQQRGEPFSLIPSLWGLLHAGSSVWWNFAGTLSLDALHFFGSSVSCAGRDDHRRAGTGAKGWLIRAAKDKVWCPWNGGTPKSGWYDDIPLFNGWTDEHLCPFFIFFQKCIWQSQVVMSSKLFCLFQASVWCFVALVCVMGKGRMFNHRHRYAFFEITKMFCTVESWF